MASLSLAPVNIFKAGADEERAETARLSSFIGAIAIGDLVKSTLGPKGMDKILLSSGRDASLMVTNDGATILKNIGVDNPAAKVLVDMSRVQDDEVGDGTTSVTVLAAELLREAESLIAKKIHPQTIIAGWREATKAAREALLSSAVDHGSDEVRFWQDLMNIAGTTLSSKLLTHHKDHFTKLAVEAVLRLKGSGNLEAIHVIKKLGGSLADSYLDEGFLLDKKIGVNQPKRIENAKILIANTGMDTDKIKIFGSRVRVDSTAKVAEIEHAGGKKTKEGRGAGPDARSFRARPAQPRLAAVTAFFLVWSDDEAALPLRPASRTRRSSGNARSGSADVRRPRFLRCLETPKLPGARARDCKWSQKPHTSLKPLPQTERAHSL